MSKRIQLRRGTASENSSFKGAVGEVTVDTTNKTLRVHDGTTSGGTTLATVNQLPAVATTSYVGVIRIATQTEVNTGTNNTNAMTPNTLSGGVKTILNASGSAPIYACRAWVNFNGASNAIGASGNVSSITDTGAGRWGVNLSTGMQDANYSVSINSSGEGTSGAAAINVTTKTTSTISLQAWYGGDNTVGSFEPSIVDVAVFR